jgi:hypothetical protein
MEKPRLFRRLFHLTGAFYLVYYILPEELIPGFFKWYGVVILVFAALIVEVIRIKTKKIVYGMRKYERRQISAYAWFAMGMGLALLLFPMIFVVPVVIGMAAIDPLIGEIRFRKKELYPIVPFIFYGIIMFVCLFLFSDMAIWILVLFTIVGTFCAIYAESWNFKAIDDDFLMIVVPLMVLFALDYLLFTIFT